MISKEEPKNFKPRFSIVSCFCEYDGRFILLHRHANKSQGFKWGVPAGKMEVDELPEDAVIRELQEETGIDMKRENMKYFGKVYVRYPDYDFIYHIFHAVLDGKVSIKIRSSEHLDSVWVTPKEALDMQLVDDLDACIKLFYSIK